MTTNFTFKALFVMLLGAVTVPGLADQPRFPSDPELNMAMKQAEKPNWGAISNDTAGAHDVFDAAIGELSPEISRKQNQSFGGVDPTGVPGIDIEKLAQQYMEGQRQASQVEKEEGALYVFVSMSMPKASIARVIADAEKSGAILVWRGLVGETFKDTFRVFRDLIGEHVVAMQIDPTKFERFNVVTAPATVLLLEPLQRCGDKCVEPPPRHYRVDGDVSLGYALEAIVRAKPDARPAAEAYLAKLAVRP